VVAWGREEMSVRGSYQYTPEEIERMDDLVQALILDRCRREPAYLRSVVDDYLDIPDDQKESLVAACTADPERCHSLVHRYVMSLGEREVHALLRDNLPENEIASRLGFDPWDPERLQRRPVPDVFNRRQWLVVLLRGAVFLLVTCFYQPYTRQTWEIRQAPFFSETRVEELVAEEYTGHRCVFSRRPLPPPDLRYIGKRQQDGWEVNVWHEVSYGVSIRLLFLEWVLLIAGGALIVYLLREKKTATAREENQPPGESE
jgi:hypothetical protein